MPAVGSSTCGTTTYQCVLVYCNMRGRRESACAAHGALRATGLRWTRDAIESAQVSRATLAVAFAPRLPAAHAVERARRRRRRRRRWCWLWFRVPGRGTRIAAQRAVLAEHVARVSSVRAQPPRRHIRAARKAVEVHELPCVLDAHRTVVAYLWLRLWLRLWLWLWLLCVHGRCDGGEECSAAQAPHPPR